MAFEFLREELTEARYIRRPNEVTGASGFDLSEDFYEHLLALQQMRYESPAWAQKYAKDTLRYMNFSQVRTGATDLHNLAAILGNPSKFKDKVTDLDNISFEVSLRRTRLASAPVLCKSINRHESRPSGRFVRPRIYEFLNSYPSDSGESYPPAAITAVSMTFTPSYEV